VLQISEWCKQSAANIRVVQAKCCKYQSGASKVRQDLCHVLVSDRVAMCLLPYRSLLKGCLQFLQQMAQALQCKLPWLLLCMQQ
jgi:hypothetical protein